jgi:hypothetical protein
VLRRTLALLGGLGCAAYGGVLIALGGRVEGGAWFGVPVLLGGGALVGLVLCQTAAPTPA